MPIPKLFFQKSRDALSDTIVNMVKYSLTDAWIYTNYINGDELGFFQENPHPEFPNIAGVFNSLKRGEHRADLFRYYYLFMKGGLYMDSDAMIYQPVDTIVKDYSFISVNSWVVNTISNCVIGSEKGHPIIYQALKRVYTMNVNLLDTDFHYICRDLYNIYTSFNGDKSNCILLNEIANPSGDRIVDSNHIIMFKHFWRNKENIPNHLLSIPIVNKNKNLIYFCVFYNKDYFKLLNLLLISMKIYSPMDSFDLLILTSPDFEQDVHELSTKLNIKIQIMTCNFTTIFQAACARLHIFDYFNLEGYEKLLYLDTDILIKEDPGRIFNLELHDLLYGIESGTIESMNFGGEFFNFNSINRNLTGINSGTLLFKNSQTIRELFTRIRNHIENFTKSNLTPPYCLDQPFINYHAIKDSIYDNKLLNPHVSLFEGNDTVDNYITSSICHFSFPIGNFGHKFYRMQEFLDKTLNRSINSMRHLDILGKQFTWGKGYIKFYIDVNGFTKLDTYWGNGFYKILDNTMILASWNNYNHILKFNSEVTEYVSIRTLPRDFEYSTGSINEAPLYIYGDSHACASFDGLQILNRNLFCHGATMFKIGRDNSIINFLPSHCSKDRIFIFVYGEVDSRCHVGKQVQYGRHHLTVCRELVEAYFRTIHNLITEYKAIIIVAVSPVVDPNDHNRKDHIHDPPIPFTLTNDARIIYTDEINRLLKEYCLKYGYHYFNPYDFYKRADGCLNYTMSDTCLHIGDTRHFLKAFNILYKTISFSVIPVILHTCDKYKQYWNPWFFYFKKYVKAPFKVYFLCEEEDPDFMKEVTVIKTGVGEWGERLIKGLNLIPESYIYYMQEDFWACKTIDLSIYLESFVNYKMDALRIMPDTYLITLENVKNNSDLFKFSQNSAYLMTHRFSLWDKDFFMRFINPKDDPWKNELEQSNIISDLQHSIYMIKYPWYNEVVRKGHLEPLGQKMLEDMRV